MIPMSVIKAIELMQAIAHAITPMIRVHFPFPMDSAMIDLLETGFGKYVGRKGLYRAFKKM